MPTLTPSQAFLIGFIVAPTLFALCAYFTRASARRVAGALVGGAAYSALNYAWDQAAFLYGWWSYPAWLGTGKAPLTLYALAGIVGGALGLVGWRIVRRFGWQGFVSWLLFWAVYAVVHDYGGSKAFASSQLMVFGPGLTPIIADMLWFVTGNAAPLLAIRIIGGPANADSLARARPASAR
jgi:hypothetical protein